MNVAWVELPGGARHPERGWSRNKDSEMIAVLRYGNAIVHFLGEGGEASSTHVGEGSSVRIPAGVAYAWEAEPDNNLGFTLISAPPWDVRQYEHIEG